MTGEPAYHKFQVVLTFVKVFLQTVTIISSSQLFWHQDYNNLELVVLAHKVIHI